MNKKPQIIIKIIFLALILLFPVFTILQLVLKFPIYVSFIYLGVVIFVYLLTHIINSLTNEYQCKKCKHIFKISFITDITAYNAKPGAKVLTCPKCENKEVTEIYNK